eukprot:1820740-Rhodomonas_salina.1
MGEESKALKAGTVNPCSQLEICSRVTTGHFADYHCRKQPPFENALFALIILRYKKASCFGARHMRVRSLQAKEAKFA